MENLPQDNLDGASLENQDTFQETPPENENEANLDNPNEDNQDAENSVEKDAQTLKEERARAVEEAIKNHKKAKEAQHELEKLRKENEELKSGTKAEQKQALSEEQIQQLVEQKLQEKQQGAVLEETEKAEKGFYLQHNIAPGSELFRKLREEVNESEPNSPEQMQKLLRRAYLDYTYGKGGNEGLGINNAPVMMGGASNSKVNDSTGEYFKSAKNLGGMFGLTEQDYQKYGKKAKEGLKNRFGI